MNRRPQRLLGLLLGVVLAAAACGGSSSSSKDSGGSGSASGSTGGTGQLAGQSVEVAAVWTGQEQASFKKVLAAFTAKTGASARYTATGDDIATVLGTRIEGGSPPDVAILPQPGLLTELAGRGALKPIDDVAGTAVDKNYAPVWRQLGTVDGRLYGAWFKAANKSTVWYDAKAFDAAGVSEPKTWDDFMKASQTLADSGVPAVSIGGGDGWTLTDWFENVYLRVAGPEKYDQLATHQIPWTDETVKTSLRTLAELWGKPNLLAGGTQGSLSADFPTSVTRVFTDPPKAAMVYEGDFVAGVISGETKAKVGTDAKFFTFPSINGSKPAVVGGGDVAVMLKDTPGARALISFLASPQAAEVWAKRGGFTSPNKNVDTGVYPDAVAKKIAGDLTSAEVFRFDMSDLAPAAFGGTPGQGEWKALQDFLANPADVDGTAAKLESLAAAAFKK